jgi:ATP-dependent DNA helicase RecG
MKSLKELINELNATDETVTIEAKRGSAIDRSVLETVCAYSNEPNIEGGYILLGIERVENSLFPMYEVTGVSDPDKLQLDLSTQCASMFFSVNQAKDRSRKDEYRNRFKSLD